MIWVLFVVRAIVSLAVIGVALAVVRPRAPRASYALAAAAGLDLLSSCCLRISYSQIPWSTMESSSLEPVDAALTCVGGVQGLLVGALVIAALALGAREAKTPPSA